MRDFNMVDADSDDNIVVICRVSTFKRVEPQIMSFEEEFRSFDNTMDEKMSAFSFLKRDEAGVQFR